MKQQQFTPQGTIIKELTLAEVQALATEGNPEARKEIFTEALKSADTIDKKLNAILEFLK